MTQNAMKKQATPEKYICIHGHFYQPPRENAWLEEIEIQESASPYHDWNERIAHECYGPNAYSRIMNEEGQIERIVNNYTRISFNFGPTLLSWLEAKMPRIYQSILQADQDSQALFQGHGSAIAQVYNHLIMPLANRRDKITQIRWGLYDFEQRFKRKAEGMWLAETAVDTETLSLLAEYGVKYTILAPSQAARWRASEEEEWHEGIDPRRPYWCHLPEGRKIALFFYDGDRSQGVAFNGYLNDGRKFAEELLNGFSDSEEPELMHIATDGESYGHHHKNGDMALAYCLHYLESSERAQLCNYGYYLAAYPPQHEAEIKENTAWSCAHGVGRWERDCGCHTGGLASWTQQWRKPLREGLDWLRDAFNYLYETEVGKYVKDPWEMRDRYIEILFKREREKLEDFIQRHSRESLTNREMTHVIRLLDMQKQALLMYTSCGWFFNDISGIETVQILQYACRGIQLARSETSENLEPKFLDYLAEARSNITDKGSGKDLYLREVKPRKLSLTQVGMHYAANSLFKDDPEVMTVLNYDCRSEEFHRMRSGNHVLITGRTYVQSRVTLSEKSFTFVILYMGNHHLVGNTADNLPPQDFQEALQAFNRALDEGNLARLLELIRHHFRGRSFSFFDLFKDQQHKLLEQVLDSNLDMAAESYEKINNSNQSLLNVMRNQGLPIPELLRLNLEVITRHRIERLFERSAGLIAIAELREQLRTVQRWHMDLDASKLSFLLTKKINRLIYNQEQQEVEESFIKNMGETLRLAHAVGIYPQIIELQNLLYRLHGEAPERWLGHYEYRRLAEQVNLAVEEVVVSSSSR